VQTALAKSWFAWRRIDGPPEAYVHKVMVTTFASWWQRRWRGEAPTAELPDSGQPDRTVDVDERDELWRAVGRLPRQQRAVIVLRYYEDLSEVEIAAALGVSAGTVKSQASRALAALRKHGELTISGGDR
jgi:RNA polymerase sigma-70 factor (sigma-E family)